MCDKLSVPIESKSHLSTTYRDGPRQPVLLSCKQTLICSKLGSFDSHWYSRYPFVEYLESHDAVYWFVCRHFPPKCGNADKRFVETGCRNWKKLGDKLQKDVESGSHVEAAAQWSAAKESDVTGSVFNKLDTHHNQVVIRNRDAVTTLIRAVLFCARQSIALRGHRKSTHGAEDISLNRGNWLSCATFYQVKTQNWRADVTRCRRVRPTLQNYPKMTSWMQSKLFYNSKSVTRSQTRVFML
jgi:hypothetical protein